MAEKPTPSKSVADEMAAAEKALGGPEVDPTEKSEADATGGDPAPASAKKKKKKGKKGSGPSISTRLREGAAAAKLQIIELAKSLRSPDAPTRRMSVFFFLSLAGVLSVGVLTIQHRSRAQHELEERIRAEAEREAARREEAELYGQHDAASSSKAHSMLNLGLFTIELKPVEGRKRTKGFMDMAEVELYVECDSKETHDYLEENLAQVRSQLSSVLVSMDRQELLSRDGKRKLKKRLLERLNGWMPSGRVQAIFFSKLVVA